jgi:hypothetical protein
VGFGCVWALIMRNFERACQSTNEKATRVFLTVYLMYFGIFLVRTDMLEFVRSVLYYACVPIILSKVRVGGKSIHEQRLYHSDYGHI